MGKHCIYTNDINMDECVVIFNELVKSISRKYGPPTLNMLVISKEIQSGNNTGRNFQNVQNSQNANSTSDLAKAATVSNGKLSVKEPKCAGDGRYVKGFFHKMAIVNFNLKLDIEKKKCLKIYSVNAKFEFGKYEVIKPINTDCSSSIEINLESNKLSSNIKFTKKIEHNLCFRIENHNFHFDRFLRKETMYLCCDTLPMYSSEHPVYPLTYGYP